MFLGIIILTVGIVFLLEALGIIGSFNWTFFWGILLVVLGIKMLTRKRHCMHCEWFGHKDHFKEHDHTK